jgi:hypothetical protein
VGILPTSSILVGRRGLAAPILSEKIYRKATKVAKERGGEEGVIGQWSVVIGKENEAATSLKRGMAVGNCGS